MSIFDELFRLALLTGMLLSAALPVLGAYLRMRSEWLAALGLSNVAAAGAALGIMLAVPSLLVSLVAVAAASAGKLMILGISNKRRGSDFYAILILAGWGALILLSANSHDALLLSQALIDGQLLFVDRHNMLSAALFAVLLVVVLFLFSDRLFMDRFFPDYFSANSGAGWPHRFAFEALIVSGIVIATTSTGVMAAFALIFIPPLITFSLISGWWMAVAAASGLGLISYIAAFYFTIALDQPFGPVQALILILLAAGAYFYKFCRTRVTEPT